MMVQRKCSKQTDGDVKRKCSRRVRRNAVILSSLNACPPSMRNSMIQKAPPDLIDAICECVLNILRGNVKLSKSQKEGLQKHKHKLRKLAAKGVPRKQKKTLLNQKGGFMSVLFPLIATLASTLFKPA